MELQNGLLGLYRENYDAPLQEGHRQNYLIGVPIFLQGEYLLTELVHPAAEKGYARQLGFRHRVFSEI